MKITLSTVEVAGTERGGSDEDVTRLFLRLRVTTRVNPKEVDPSSFASAVDSAFDDLPASKAEAEETVDATLWVEAGRLTSFAVCEDTLSVDWDLQKAKTLLTQRLAVDPDGEWVLNLKSGRYVFRHDFYVDGNAE